jgi:hypothetical protein
MRRSVDVLTANMPSVVTSFDVVYGTAWSRTELPHALVIVVPLVTVSVERAAI